MSCHRAGLFLDISRSPIYYTAHLTPMSVRPRSSVSAYACMSQHLVPLCESTSSCTSVAACPIRLLNFRRVNFLQHFHFHNLRPGGIHVRTNQTLAFYFTSQVQVHFHFSSFIWSLAFSSLIYSPLCNMYDLRRIPYSPPCIS